MSLPTGFATPAQAVAPQPLHVVARDSFAAWRDAQPPAVQAWLAVHRFDGAAGTALAWADAQGQLAGAVIGIGDALDPHAYAHAPTALPGADWQLAGSPGAGARCALQLGWGLGCYRFDRYKASTRAPARLVADDFDAETFDLLAACASVRDLVNTPTEHMGPDELEAAARALAQAHGAAVEVVAGDDLLAQNYPAIHAVGRASHRAPRIIELAWGDAAHPHVAICGKGVCFDTGGLDIKAATGMRNMKKDMGGAAHALALAGLVMARKLPLRITLLVAAVENAIGPNAFRPGEVIATRKGVSVEIDNTDAEGRIVLCDALARAGELKPDLLLDFATLTGAARVALGPDLPALYANDEALAADWLTAGQQVRDPLWRMPLWRPYLRYLTSSVADLANGSATTMAGSVTAALFLERFVAEGQPWGHVDVYAWNDSDRPGKPAGGEAQGLRAAYALLKSRTT
ncbi:leucyl aminopeptidase family protein [Thermomonas sp.]|jgi:leucyl aminopeptidase|uniref:leucyl aminopeptidase family protein n=1 Tax=Thermomonas sp. TaxID=1971895 RepID=UPI001B50365A|nr:leucyl aminopeptidase family protein [Thermomonas sp.]MBK6925572.1 leucyl aminopeptidase family protein [Thermomonas sp.]MBL0228251.1 leucyl aminopeptidase family protein [Thermomonas sp.]MBP6438571.1 leucyl aminopeptidase family protein [Thermomonas sp.]MBP7158445.1 leucyl aminopeptidase family protein [Thermomonas sp.]MBP7789419.1 leucyl aminopeptidase family protein [Thermomonas sp.]